MKIGLLSDTHDDLKNVQAAVALFAREGITTLLHCGDVCGPAVVELLADLDVTFAQGNMDRVPALGMAVETLHGRSRLALFHHLLLDGFPIALLHGHEEGRLQDLIRSGRYAYIFHGHTHRRTDRRFGRTRVINPGALGGTRHESRSLCVLDLETGHARFLEIVEAKTE